MRNRSGVVIIQSGRIALIRRLKNGEVYYVIPGGGIEKGEIPIEAAIREAEEELGVVVHIEDLIHIEDYNGTQYFYSAKIVGGLFGKGTGKELTEPSAADGTYEPMWVDCNQLHLIDLRPVSLVRKIQNLT